MGSRIFKYDWEDAFHARARLGLSASAVVLCVFKYASADGEEIFPSLSTICETLGTPGKPVAKNTVRAGLRAAVEAGWLVVTQEDTRTTPKHYRLAIPDAAAEPARGSSGEPRGAGDEPRGASGEPGVVQEMHPKRPGNRPFNRSVSRAGAAEPRAVPAARSRGWKDSHPAPGPREVTRSQHRAAGPRKIAASAHVLDEACLSALHVPPGPPAYVNGLEPEWES